MRRYRPSPWCAGIDDAEADVVFPEGFCELTQLQQLRATSWSDDISLPIWKGLPAAFSQLSELRRLELSCLGLHMLDPAITGLMGATV